MVWYSEVLSSRKTPLSSAWALCDSASAMTAQTPQECSGIKSLWPTVKNIPIYPEECQLTVRDSSPELLKRSGEKYCVQWECPDLGEISELDFPRDNSGYTLLLEKIYLETLNNPQGLLVTVCLEMMGTSSRTLILGMDGLSNFSFFSEFYVIIHAKWENVIRELLQYVPGSDFNTKVKRRCGGPSGIYDSFYLHCRGFSCLFTTVHDHSNSFLWVCSLSAIFPYNYVVEG